MSGVSCVFNIRGRLHQSMKIKKLNTNKARKIHATPTSWKKLVRLKPDRPDRFLRPCEAIHFYSEAVEGVRGVGSTRPLQRLVAQHPNFRVVSVLDSGGSYSLLYFFRVDTNCIVCASVVRPSMASA